MINSLSFTQYIHKPFIGTRKKPSIPNIYGTRFKYCRNDDVIFANFASSFYMPFLKRYNVVGPDTEMEFIDISLTKDLSLLLHAIHTSQSFYWQIFKENLTPLWF